MTASSTSSSWSPGSPDRRIRDARGMWTLLKVRNHRSQLSLSLLVIDSFVFALTLDGSTGSLRFVLGLIFGLVIPGWAIVGPVQIGNAALEFGLTITTSMVVLMIAAQILITLNAWHLTAFEEVTCLLCAPSLIYQVRGKERRRGRHYRSERS